MHTERQLISAFQLIANRTAWAATLAEGRFAPTTKPAILVMSNMTLDRCGGAPDAFRPSLHALRSHLPHTRFGPVCLRLGRSTHVQRGLP